MNTNTFHVYFNTSHVSINRSLASSFVTSSLGISIHLMFLLIDLCRSCLSAAPRISIHLMFLLIWKGRKTWILQKQISIHLMFLLIKTENEKIITSMNFNTSHVSINPTLLSAFPFLLYLKFLENTSFFKFFPSVSQT